MKGYLVVAQIAGPAPVPPGDLPPMLPSVWTEIDGAGKTLIVARFADRSAAEEHEREWITKTAPSIIDAPTPDIRGLSVEEERGRKLAEAPVGSYMSLVHFQAPMGRGEEMGEDVSETLETFRMVPGYEGHVRAFNVSLEDELWAFVLWSDVPPVPTSGEDLSFSRYQRSR